MNASLTTAVLEQMNIDADNITEEDKGMLEDICNYGITGGFTGFIYYSDTVPFYNDNRKDILSMLAEMASEFGSTAAEVLAGFNCIDATTEEADSFLMGLSDDDSMFSNALAWYAAEEVARSIIEA